MRHRMSVKIFVISMTAFLILLFISMNLNIEAQKNLYCNWIIETYRYDEIVDKAINLFQKYQIYNIKDKEKILKVIDDYRFQKDFQQLCDGYQNYVFITYPENNQNIIASYTLGEEYLDDYLVLYNQDNDKSQTFSIASLPSEKKQELLSVLKIRDQTNEYSEDKSVYVKYQLDNDQLKYFECYTQSKTIFKIGESIEMNQKVNQTINEGVITSYCIQNECRTINPIHFTSVIFHVDEMKQFVMNNRYYNGRIGGFLKYSREIDNQTYFLANSSISDYESRFSVNIVNVVDNLHNYIVKQYISENCQLYIIAFILAIIISFLVSYLITKPLKKVQKVALAIANQNFDEPLQIKSKDEIGILSQSIDAMRVQLKQTIEQLNNEIEHVKKLESLRKDFINQFTHEMKTPLGIINGYGELIEDTKDDKERSKYIEIIYRETQRINQLIQSMLSLSRLEAGKVELNKEEFDLEDSVTEIIDEYEVLFMKKNIVVEVNTVNAMIYGDKKLIETVVHNFLSNALKHTNDNGYIRLTIHQGLEIYNTGELIPEDQLDNIWYTFVTHDQQGSGLGLAICQSILELHQYDYGVKNCQDGVQFYFHMKEFL